MREKLINILGNIQHGKTKLLPTWMIEPLVDALIENGVTISKFKVGDIVWVYDFMWGIIPCEVDRPYHCHAGREGSCTYENSFTEEDIGEYVFATKEEAEAMWPSIDDIMGGK